MNQNNTRKEPTFGQPTPPENTNQTASQKLSFSVQSKVSPEHTFTSVLKHPQDSAVEPSLEEQVTHQKSEPINNPTTPHKSAGFTFAPVVEDNQAIQTAEQEVATKTENVVEESAATLNPNTLERVIPTQSAPTKTKATATDKVPSKYRRLIVVLLLALAIIAVIWLLKPNTPETVEELQQQGTNLPIEFRPVDESEAKRAEEEAKALQQAHQQEELANQAQTSTPVQSEGTVENTHNTNTESTPIQVAPATEPAQPVEIQPVVTEPIKKPSTNGSVIYQPESSTANHTQTATTAKPERRVEKLKPAPQPTKVEAKAEKAPVVVKAKAEPTKPVEMVKRPEPVVAKAVEHAPAPTINAEVVASKTMVVPKGVSLMQVFRDHNLNISDVNAMSKANNIVSNLKVGEKVTVRLDKNNRVAEMSIGSGGRFIRQTNGTYIFK